MIPIRFRGEDFMPKLGHPLNEYKEDMLRYMNELGLGERLDIRMPFSVYIKEMERNPWMFYAAKRRLILPEDILLELVSTAEMDTLAAYGGVPKRYPHERWYQDYLHYQRSSEYGLHRIHEMILSCCPGIAYLGPEPAFKHKRVLAHIPWHIYVMWNNLNFYAHWTYFSKIIDIMANHAMRIMQFIDRYGDERVNEFISACISVEDLIDRSRMQDPLVYDIEEWFEEENGNSGGLSTDHIPSYLEPYVNPDEFKQEFVKKKQEIKDRILESRLKQKYPYKPEADIALFLALYAPLEEWQREVLLMIREESYYYAPMGATKILNEGFAKFGDSAIMSGLEHPLRDNTLLIKPFATDAEIIDVADMSSRVTAWPKTGINPYALGSIIFWDIYDRWNKGKFGPEWEDCLENGTVDDWREWDKKTGLGWQKVKEVAACANDVTFIDTYLSHELCVNQKLFTYHLKSRDISSREPDDIKRVLLFNLTNAGKPKVVVENANYNNKGDLLLVCQNDFWHTYQINVEEAREALGVITRKIWKRPAYLMFVNRHGNEEVITPLYDD